MRAARMLSPTSYHLAVVLLAYTNAAGDPARKRLNLLEEAFSDVLAKLQTKGNLSKETTDTLTEIEQDLRLLRDSYEPIIDLDPWAYKKLAAFEGILFETRTAIMTLIEGHDLTGRDEMAEIMVSPVLRRVGQ